MTVTSDLYQDQGIFLNEHWPFIFVLSGLLPKTADMTGVSWIHKAEKHGKTRSTQQFPLNEAAMIQHDSAVVA